jgi:hypothetical protein
MHDAAWVNAQLATMVSGYGTVADGVVAVTGGKISWVGPRSAWRGGAREEHDARGAWITPGLVDCHTHLVYAGNRASEFELRLKGASYEEIARAGGGIVSTVKATRAASEAELFRISRKRIQSWLDEGATAIEIKSGYGLDRDTELRMLRVARRLGEEITVKTTFLGAHALPPEYAGRADEYIDFVCEEVLPAAAKEGLADAVDAFCERIAFDVSQTGRVFEKAKALGLPALGLGRRGACRGLPGAFGGSHGILRRARNRSDGKGGYRRSVVTGRVLFPEGNETAAHRCIAQTRRADRARHRPQPGQLAGFVAAPDPQHGMHAVSADARGGARRHDASRGAGARAAENSRQPRAGQGGRSCPLGHRLARRARVCARG